MVGGSDMLAYLSMFYTSPWGRHPRIQLRTVGDLLGGRGLDYPHVTGANVTHRRAERAPATGAVQSALFAANDLAEAGDPNEHDGESNSQP
jgi:hypothetical protein